MGISFQTCSCVKNNSEEKNSEFKPEYIKERNKNNPLSTKTEIKDTLTSPRYTPSKQNTNLMLPRNYTFGDRSKTATFSSEKLLKLQALIRAFVFRKKFFNTNGIKESLSFQTATGLCLLHWLKQVNIQAILTFIIFTFLEQAMLMLSKLRQIPQRSALVQRQSLAIALQKRCLNAGAPRASTILNFPES